MRSPARFRWRARARMQLRRLSATRCAVAVPRGTSLSATARTGPSSSATRRLSALVRSALLHHRGAGATLPRAMAREILADYPQDEGRHDEMFAAAHEPRAHWKPMLDQLAEEPAERMRERLHTVQRRI